MSDTVRIAVIGAGPAGIAQAKQAIDTFNSERYAAKTLQPRKLELIVFESRDQVGGVWVLDEQPGEPLVSYANNGSRAHLQPPPGENPSPMYPDLRTNLPKSIMTYRGTSWPEEIPEFPHPQQVHGYLKGYAGKYDLLRHIRFNTVVTRVRLDDTASMEPSSSTSVQRRWRVEFSSQADGSDPHEESFDYVSVANGHYSHPWIPDVPGLSNFKGQLLHSRWFRRGSDFRGRSVLVVGSFASGYDVARMIAAQNYSESESGQLTPGEKDHHTRVYQSSTKGDVRGAHPQPWDRYIDSRPVISRIEKASGESKGIIHFNDGSSVSDVDTIIYATGYYLSYPFLKAADRPWSDPAFRVVEDVIDASEASPKDQGGLKALSVGALDGLFLFLERDRTIAFLGLPFSIIPFPFFETQAHLTSLTWAGLLPNLPKAFTPPLNASLVETSATSAPSPDADQNSSSAQPAAKHVRTTQTLRKGLAFTPDYDFVYQDYILSLTREGDGGEAEKWGRVEDWRREIRADKERRYRFLGY